MHRALAVFGFVGILALGAASFTVLPTGTTKAAGTADNATFLIPASDGYGVEDCLSSSSDATNSRTSSHSLCALRSVSATS